jgi:trk system potassium uptake protein TrkA
MRVVILGCGRVGAYLAKSLAEAGHQIAVIDENSLAFVRLGPDFTGKMVVGTGVDEDVLRRAGTEHADAFVAVTNGDNTNMMAAQVAREVFGVQRVICRVYDPLRGELYRTLGLETICSTTWAVNRIKELLENRSDGEDLCISS